jgi:hypothetical protein
VTYPNYANPNAGPSPQPNAMQPMGAPAAVMAHAA